MFGIKKGQKGAWNSFLKNFLENMQNDDLTSPINFWDPLGPSFRQREVKKSHMECLVSK